ncbi:cysteine-rich CWC family protein, partial [Psychrobacter sp. 1Y1]|uniref:cysteine-rich CWC family protein n=1 Tax=Psychrobacter sp. 1Y1 TaxID=3453574 RepID=UPI003F4653FB
ILQTVNTSEFTSMSHQAPLDSDNRCPLCQGFNHCAAQTGTGIEQCWCSKQEFPDKRLLTHILAADELASLTGTDCICESCLLKLKALQDKDSHLYKRID